MKVPFYTSVREYSARKNEFDSAVAEVMAKGDFILGGAVAELEKEISAYSNSAYSVGVANGSDALVLASDICGFKDGAEVLTPVFTFFASASCIARLGGKPVFCDVEEDTYCMDMNDAASRLSPKTKGIIPVHLFTQMADMTSCMKIAEDNKLAVVEDAAEAFGMKQKYKGTEKSAGTIGDFGVYSFFPTKTLGGYGDGGLVTINSEENYKKVKSLRVHGSSVKYHHDYVGYNSRLDTIQAAILRVKLQKIDEGIALRKERADQYYSLLEGISEVKLPVIKNNNIPVFYVFSIQAERRDELNSFLQVNGIGTSVYYPVPLHMQKCFEYLGHKKGDFPVAEKLCSKALALPIFPELEEDEVSYVCEKIREFYKK